MAERQLSTTSSGSSSAHVYTSDEEEDEDMNNTLSDLRDSRGLCEIEISEEGEAGIQENVEACIKNKGHYVYHHVQEFAKRHLPEGYKDRELVRAVQTCSDLTVNIIHCSISPNRPEFFPNTTRNYPLYGKKNKAKLCRGTGWIWKVEQYGEGSQSKEGPCQCLDCQYSNNPKKIWWEIIIMTAAHVVFDIVECKTTQIILWDEKGVKKENDRRLVLKAREMGDSSIEADRGMFTCVTHDAELAKKLKTLCRRRAELVKNCDDKYSENPHSLTIAISHPHGDLKRVSIGTGIDRDDQELASQYSYNTPTCHGSSGGFVWAVGWGSSHGSVAPHSEGDINQTNSNENKSGWSWHL